MGPTRGRAEAVEDEVEEYPFFVRPKVPNRVVQAFTLFLFAIPLVAFVGDRLTDDPIARLPTEVPAFDLSPYESVEVGSYEDIFAEDHEAVVLEHGGRILRQRRRPTMAPTSLKVDYEVRWSTSV